MKRLIIGGVIAAMSLALGSSAAWASAWDPEHPPAWIPVQMASERPSGDEGSWVDPHNRIASISPVGDLFQRLLLKVTVWFIVPSAQPSSETTIPDIGQSTGGVSHVSGS